MFRPLITTLLTLALSLSLALSGALRPPLVPGLQVDLCSDAGVVTVTLDAAGRPVAPHPPCPDCLVGPAATLPPPVLLQAFARLGADTARPLLPSAPVQARAFVRPAVRAPPVPV